MNELNFLKHSLRSPHSRDYDFLMPLPLVDLPLSQSGPSEVEQRVRRVLERGRDIAVRPTGVGRERYLELMERLVRTAALWQNAEGATIDPVTGKEWGQTSP